MASWADDWIARGLCCDPADWEAWERGARACYAHAGIPWPGVVVRVSSPIVLAFAAPIAAHLLDCAVVGAVDVAVGDAVDVAVRDAVGVAVRVAVGDNWNRYLGGQWWLSWQAYEGFFREVCGLVLPGGLSQRAADYALTQQSAGWWWPHREFCADELTEILTEDGWRTHDHLAEGDIVMTLNHETGLGEWQPVDRVCRFDVQNKPMLHIEGNAISSLTTMNHRWPTMHRSRRPTGLSRFWTTSGKLNTNDSIITGARCADVPTDAKWTDALVELVAWFYTEGSLTTDGGGITIAQSNSVNPDMVARIRTALTVLYGPPTQQDMRGGYRPAEPCEFDDCGWPATNRGLYNAHNEQLRRHGTTHAVNRKTIPPTRPGQEPAWREAARTAGMAMFGLNRAAAQPILDAAPGKNVRLGFIRDLTAAQLDLFIQTSIAADGHRPASVASTGGSIAQRRGEWLDAFELACVLSGRTPHTTTVNATYRGEPYTMRRVHARECSSTWDFKAARTSTTTYTGVVWCPGTPNKTWLARRNGTVWYTGNTMVCDRPEIVRTERVRPRGWGSHRMHSSTGPAIRWRDGWALHFWHGTRVPAEWIEQPDTVDPRLALTHPQIEQRRALAEILGWERVLTQLPHRVIDTDPDPQIGTLIHVDLPNAPMSAFLRVRCGTGRHFCLPMPAEIRTARAGNAWSYGLDPEALHPEVRT